MRCETLARAAPCRAKRARPDLSETCVAPGLDAKPSRLIQDSVKLSGLMQSPTASAAGNEDDAYRRVAARPHIRFNVGLMMIGELQLRVGKADRSSAMRWTSSMQQASKLGVGMMLAGALSACGFGMAGKYLPSEYEGKWIAELESEECGPSIDEFYSAADGFSIRPYDGQLYFEFVVESDSAKSESAQIVRFRDVSTGKIAGQAVAPQFSIQFSSNRSGSGTWQSFDCEGLIKLNRI